MTRGEWSTYLRIKLQHLGNSDCGSNSCLFYGRGKGGMRTNGGCMCYGNLVYELVDKIMRNQKPEDDGK